MRFKTHSFRHADTVLNEPSRVEQYREIQEVISGITDEDLKQKHLARKDGGKNSSFSHSINSLLKERFVAKEWRAESPIFQGEEYGGDNAEKVWRLDFAKGSISIEVAFNHGEAIAWNLVKPVLASEVNNVEKAINTEVGVLITATKAMKTAGCFDNAVGEYEKVLRYLIPLNSMLTVPMLIIGLEPPESFRIVEKYPGIPDNWGEIIG